VLEAHLVDVMELDPGGLPTLFDSPDHEGAVIVS
jgi:hypothetical protein